MARMMAALFFMHYLGAPSLFLCACTNFATVMSARWLHPGSRGGGGAEPRGHFDVTMAWIFEILGASAAAQPQLFPEEREVGQVGGLLGGEHS